MSRTYLEIVLLVLTAFSLGLFVGWLAWHDAAKGDKTDLATGKARDLRHPTDERELPRWQGEQLPAGSHPPPSHRGASDEAGNTVIVGPEGNATSP